MATRLSSLVFDKSQTVSTCTSTTTENNIIHHLVYDSDETQDPNEHGGCSIRIICNDNNNMDSFIWRQETHLH